MPAGKPEAGHRLATHTADVLIEAWAPDWHACLVEAVNALVESFADVTDSAAQAGPRQAPFRIDAHEPEDQVVELLDEVIYRLDAEDVVPVNVELEDCDAGLQGWFDVVPVQAIAQTGPAPKAVALHGLTVQRDDSGWSCRVLVDV
jgi:SHS2 domain-containing protein